MKTGNAKGFTIVELLTVMGVIAVLIALLVPALNKVKDFADDVQQHAQFHSIDVGLELFKNEFGVYPESNNNAEDPVRTEDSVVYCGANKLAEAMVGWDLLGFHPKSGFNATGYNYVDADDTLDPVYDSADGDPDDGVVGSAADSSFEETASENIRTREHYVKTEDAKAFRMSDIYDDLSSSGFATEDNFVLCDVYAKKRRAGEKTGMPILYYRARTQFDFQAYDEVHAAGTYTNDYDDDIYLFLDNDMIVQLGDPDTGEINHSLTTAEEFEDEILNQQVKDATTYTGTYVRRPYNADSYILISAGKDGLYGTADDIHNFKVDSDI